jgi:hypothetical protein
MNYWFLSIYFSALSVEQVWKPAGKVILVVLIKFEPGAFIWYENISRQFFQKKKKKCRRT